MGRGRARRGGGRSLPRGLVRSFPLLSLTFCYYVEGLYGELYERPYAKVLSFRFEGGLAASAGRASAALAGLGGAAMVAVGLGRIVALSLCTTNRPLYTRFTNRFSCCFLKRQYDRNLGRGAGGGRG